MPRLGVDRRFRGFAQGGSNPGHALTHRPGGWLNRHGWVAGAGPTGSPGAMALDGVAQRRGCINLHFSGMMVRQVPSALVANVSVTCTIETGFSDLAATTIPVMRTN